MTSPPGDEWQLTYIHVDCLKCQCHPSNKVLNPQKPAFYRIFLCMVPRSARSFLKVGLFLGSYCQQLFIILAISAGQECGAGIRYPERHHNQNRQPQTSGTSTPGATKSWESCLCLQMMQFSAVLFAVFSHVFFFFFTFLHLISCLLVGHARVRCQTQGKSLPQQNTKAPHVTRCGIAT